jgi:hypothetical protein
MARTRTGKPARRNHAKALGIGLGALFLVVGLALLAGAVVPAALDHQRESRVEAEGVNAEGMVLAKYRESGGRITAGAASAPLFEYFVRYRFPVGAGAQAEGTARVSREIWGALEEREPIEVRYVRDDPGTSRVDGQLSETGVSAIVLGAVGALFTVIGGAFVYGLARAG